MHATDLARLPTLPDMLGRFAAAVANLLKGGRGAPLPQGGVVEQDARALKLPRGKGETVMIVDCDGALLILAEQMLARLGYRPSGFDSSHAALDALYDGPANYDAVLIDEALSDPCSAALAGEIRRVRRDMPILLMSCRSDTDCAGIDALLRKPLLSRDIAAPLAQVLHERRR